MLSLTIVLCIPYVFSVTPPLLESCLAEPSSVILHMPATEQDLYWFRKNIYSFLERGLKPQICHHKGRGRNLLQGVVQRRELRDNLKNDKVIHALPQSSNELLKRRRVTVYIIPRHPPLAQEVQNLPPGSFFLRWGDDLHFQRSLHLSHEPSSTFAMFLYRGPNGQYQPITV